MESPRPSTKSKTFRIAMSERCYRFKPDALMSHAPQKPGVYEFVTFNHKMEPEVLFVGLALENTVYEALAGHLMGNKQPKADELFRISKDIYFDYVLNADVNSPEDFKDIAGALIAKHKPRFNRDSTPPSSGQYPSVNLEEAG